MLLVVAGVLVVPVTSGADRAPIALSSVTRGITPSSRSSAPTTASAVGLSAEAAKRSATAVSARHGHGGTQRRADVVDARAGHVVLGHHPEQPALAVHDHQGCRLVLTHQLVGGPGTLVPAEHRDRWLHDGRRR